MTEKKPLYLELDEELHRAMVAVCETEGLTKRGLIEYLLREFMEGYNEN